LLLLKAAVSRVRTIKTFGAPCPVANHRDAVSNGKNFFQPMGNVHNADPIRLQPSQRFDATGPRSQIRRTVEVELFHNPSNSSHITGVQGALGSAFATTP